MRDEGLKMPEGELRDDTNKGEEGYEFGSLRFREFMVPYSSSISITRLIRDFGSQPARDIPKSFGRRRVR